MVRLPSQEEAIAFPGPGTLAATRLVLRVLWGNVQLGLDLGGRLRTELEWSCHDCT